MPINDMALDDEYVTDMMAELTIARTQVEFGVDFQTAQEKWMESRFEPQAAIAADAKSAEDEDDDEVKIITEAMGSQSLNPSASQAARDHWASAAAPSSSKRKRTDDEDEEDDQDKMQVEQPVEDASEPTSNKRARVFLRPAPKAIVLPKRRPQPNRSLIMSPPPDHQRICFTGRTASWEAMEKLELPPALSWINKSLLTENGLAPPRDRACANGNRMRALIRVAPSHRTGSVLTPDLPMKDDEPSEQPQPATQQQLARIKESFSSNFLETFPTMAEVWEAEHRRRQRSSN